MTLQLARDLGVPEVEVIRAFPPDRVGGQGTINVASWSPDSRSLAYVSYSLNK